MNTVDSTAIEFDLLNRTFKQLSIDELEIDFQNKDKIYWVHSNLNQKDLFHTISNKLNLPDEVIELCKQKKLMPELTDTDNALTIQTQCLILREPNEHKAIKFANMTLHLTSHFCFTATSQPTSVLLEFIKSCPKAVQYAKTPCFILFLIFDELVNDYAKTLFNFEIKLDQIDLHARQVRKNIYNEIMNVKQQVVKVKRYAIAIREILMRISGRKISVISEQCRSSLYNLSNHTHMVVHESDSIRDILNGLLDQIDNVLMQNLNETMRVLTAFAAIFLPLTLITGIYGMNFRWMPELEWQYGYFWALSLIVLCAVILLLVFKKKKWF